MFQPTALSALLLPRQLNMRLPRANRKLDWNNSHKLRSVDELKKVTAVEGSDIALWGRSTLYPPLLQANPIDRLNLLICPIILGEGKKLFGDTSHPVTLKLASSKVTRSESLSPGMKCIALTFRTGWTAGGHSKAGKLKTDGTFPGFSTNRNW
jgi:dihydrofolate reductase